MVTTIAFVAAFFAVHPLHTTLTEVTADPASRTVRATVRAFADDLAIGLRRRKLDARSDADVTAYVASGLTIRDGARTVPTRGCGVRRSGDLLWICLEATTTAPLEKITARNAILCDEFADQVNIVQSTAGSVKRSVLFTRGDEPKRVF